MIVDIIANDGQQLVRYEAKPVHPQVPRVGDRVYLNGLRYPTPVQEVQWHFTDGIMDVVVKMELHVR